MNIAIRISNKIKDQNNHSWIQNKEIGDIVKRQNYPSKFWVTKRIGCSYQHKTDLHEYDGWRPYLNLVDGVDYNTDELNPQKLNTNLIVGYPIGEPLENRTHYAFKIVDITVQEYEAQQDSNNDLSAKNQVRQYREDGQEISIDFTTKLFRRINKLQEQGGDLNGVSANKVDRFFKDGLLFLERGNFREAKRLIEKELFERWNGAYDINVNTDEIVGDGSLDEAPMRFIAKKLYEDVKAYFDNQYDM